MPCDWSFSSISNKTTSTKFQNCKSALLKLCTISSRRSWQTQMLCPRTSKGVATYSTAATPTAASGSCPATGQKIPAQGGVSSWLKNTNYRFVSCSPRSQWCRTPPQSVSHRMSYRTEKPQYCRIRFLFLALGSGEQDQDLRHCQHLQYVLKCAKCHI